MQQERHETPKSRRGFASMEPQRQREIASQGGRAAHELGVAHEWNRTEAQEAGKKGGLLSGFKRRATRDHPRDYLL